MKYAGESPPSLSATGVNASWFQHIVDIVHFVKRLDNQIKNAHFMLLVKWGRWFLQIVAIHVGNFNMDVRAGDRVLASQHVGGRLSGDRVALFSIYI